MSPDLGALRRAAEERPDDPQRWHELGVACFEGGLLDEAESCWRRVLGARPDHAKAHYNLGAILHRRDALQDAERHYRSAIAFDPKLAPARASLGMLLHSRGDEEALAHMRAAVTLEPGQAHWLGILGSICNETGNALEAKAALERAIGLDPASGFAHEQLAGCLLGMGDAPAAATLFRRAWELDPSLQTAGNNLIFALDLVDGVTMEEQQAERRRWCERHAGGLPPERVLHGNDRSPERRLRVGYVSADFRRHSASYLFAPILAHHDRSQFELYCYSGVRREDDVTARLRGYAHVWRTVTDRTDEELAAQIRSDRIDILVDLSGHSAGNRLLAFARKPAPVQVTAWGHATGTGLRAMDYFFADPVLIPAGKRTLFAESIVDLSASVCYEPPEYLPEVSALPALSGAGVVFGCINRVEKISDQVIARWGRILAALPDSTLHLKHRGLSDPGARRPLLDRLARGGVDPSRLRLADLSPHRAHLEVFRAIDVGLDPYPHGGGVSTLEALWMGVPVVTLRGMTPSSRLSAAILAAIGLHEWIAESDDDYVRIAIDAAREVHRLAELRRGLRERCRRSPVGDVERYTREVEAAYRELWRRWCGA